VIRHPVNRQAHRSGPRASPPRMLPPRVATLGGNLDAVVLRLHRLEADSGDPPLPTPPPAAETKASPATAWKAQQPRDLGRLAGTDREGHRPGTARG